MEFGSEFESSANDSYYTDIKQVLPQGIYTRSGRDALFLIAEDLHNYNINTICMPALCCPSMVDPFVHSGFKINYYAIADGFQGTLKNDSIGEEVCILVNSYFGKMSLAFHEVECLKLKNPNSKFLLDFTHSFFKYYKEINTLHIFDYCIASIRKWLYLPSGGGLFSENPIKALNSKNYNFANLRKQALQSKDEYLQNLDGKLKDGYRRLLSQAEMELQAIDSPNTITLIDSTSSKILERININLAAKVRMENAVELYDSLSTIQNHIIMILTKDEIFSNPPLYFPVISNCRDDLQKKLAEKYSIYCPVIWPIPEKAYGVSKRADMISQSMLAIPCDQRYSTQDMRFISLCVKKVLSCKN